MSHNAHESFRTHLVKHLPAMIGLMLVMFALEYFGLLHGYETRALDVLFGLQGSRESQQVMIVSVGDDEYHDPELFDGTSPLRPDGLKKILDAVAAGGPSVIAVDFDSSSEAFRNHQWPPAVWACDAEPVADDEHGGHGSVTIHPFPALGGELIAQPASAGVRPPRAAVVLFPRDHDGIVRRYRRVFDVVESEGDADGAHPAQVQIDSLPWAAFKAFEATNNDRHGNNSSVAPTASSAAKPLRSEDLLMNFAGDRYSFARVPARVALIGAKQSWWSERSPLKDKIVLVGGFYREARDEYITPVGPMQGVELLAQAIETELLGGGIRPLNTALAMAIEFIASVLLVYVNWRYPSPRAITLSLICMCAAAVAGSFLAFRTLAFFFNIGAYLFGVWTHLQYDNARDRRQLRKEVEEYRRRFGPLGAKA
ncbi:MAG TPA: CHASE2 domain-containing protein [Pirellulales bacterium]|nr:CHASE2 domain-containing protein [Pirellulales bacterium]